jgi:hypothetical protein
MRYPGTPLEPGAYRVPVTGVFRGLQGVRVLEAPCNLEPVGGPLGTLWMGRPPYTLAASQRYT